jgi:hypothetical protein
LGAGLEEVVDRSVAGSGACEVFAEVAGRHYS